jgi:hypothetical protein
MDLLSFAIIAFIVMGFNKFRKWGLRTWHRKKFCESNRSLCRALVTAGFPDLKKYLYFKEDASSYDEHRFEDGYINFYKSEMSQQDIEKILNVVEEYYFCSTDEDIKTGITRIFLKGKKWRP